MLEAWVQTVVEADVQRRLLLSDVRRLDAVQPARMPKFFVERLKRKFLLASLRGVSVCTSLFGAFKGAADAATICSC